ncbi:MAG: hypothetical protein K1X68_03815 [Saprospiraceae bacterium]|nr:hypothetical protein [Saprospiraceae bacterium]MBX7175876.1 hypothetical protein [Saprospiraceae bacterium]HMW40465.1 hypothetical protein [Saprospiraceae bacterium]HMX88861.1 hypothetical protein [Saprospiraceae bacterium]HMZ41010.1 hypothetical protein [Saprospiraceae bacterium]
MQKIKQKHLVLLAIGTFLSGSSIIIRHYVEVSDFTDGMLKGIGIGVMIYSIYRISRDKPSEKQ